MSKKLPVSALIVSTDEGHLLKKCLPSVSFCEQVVVVDLESKDQTYTIAQSMGAEVLRHSRLPIVEMVHAQIVARLKYAWVLFLDPDEVIDSTLANDLDEIFQDRLDNVGLIKVPWIFYFKHKKLYGTSWGGVSCKGLIGHRDRIELKPYVHSGKVVKDNFSTKAIQYKGTNVVHHYWMSTYEELYIKHKRYLTNEGRAMYKTGLTYNFRDHLYVVRLSFWDSFYHKKGYRDGLKGFILSIFWAWYKIMCWFSLRSYEQQLKGPA